jgi:hypothetical protein
LQFAAVVHSFLSAHQYRPPVHVSGQLVSHVPEQFTSPEGHAHAAVPRVIEHVIPPEHVVVVSHCPSEEQVSTDSPEHCIAPWVQTPPQAPPVQTYEHVVGAPHWPSDPHVSTWVSLVHCVAVGVQTSAAASGASTSSPVPASATPPQHAPAVESQ